MIYRSTRLFAFRQCILKVNNFSLCRLPFNFFLIVQQIKTFSQPNMFKNAEKPKKKPHMIKEKILKKRFTKNNEPTKG